MGPSFSKVFFTPVNSFYGCPGGNAEKATLARSISKFAIFIMGITEKEACTSGVTVDEKALRCYISNSGMTVQLRNKICCVLSLILVFALVQVHFLGDPCLIHCEHTAHSLGSTLSVRAMNCLCFFHAFYVPIGVPFFVFLQEIRLTEYVYADRTMPLLSFDIFHPPRG